MKKKIFAVCVMILIWMMCMGAGVIRTEQEPSGPGNKAELIMLPGTGAAQMLSAVIKTSEGSLIVIDGGWEADGEPLGDLIVENGGRVKAWLLTHPHEDHVGALYHILRNRRDEIQIDKIYYSFTEPSWYRSVAPANPGMAEAMTEELEKLPEEMKMDSVGKGTVITVDDVVITALNDRYELESDPVNNSSIVYRIDVKGKRVLFLGDLGYYGGIRLLEECGAEELKADMVQMAHHGQNGVGQEVYQAISPSVCLWPTPAWLWDNDGGNGPGSGPWKTLETRGWMQELNVERNYCIKDGEIRLLL